ncbi:MAG: universal stress protein [Cyanobacteria bacterium P01_D01_bin.105]
MFDRILAALDLNDHDYEHLFNQMLSLAKQTQAKLVLIQVLDAESDYTASFPYYAGTTGYPLVFDETLWSRHQAEYQARKENGKRILTKFVEAAANIGVEAKFIQAEGDAGKTICGCAQTENVDLVIVGSHGRRGLEEFLIGSVSSYVMHRAPCAVMIAREKDRYEEVMNNNYSEADVSVP